MALAGGPPGALRIQLLGGFSVSIGEHEIASSAWRLQKARALVKVLALALGHKMHRERLLELLWPDLDPIAAANNLYICLHVARRALAASPAARALGGPLRLKQHIVSLESPTGLWIDVEAFEVAAGAARVAGDAAACERALALYTGDLLPEDHYDDWITGRREALRETYLDLLFALSRHAESRQDYPAAIEALRRAVGADPVREEAHVGLMWLYALLGRRGDALRQYAQLEQVLRRELDTEPDAESARLRDEITAGRFPAVQAQAPAQAPASYAGPPDAPISPAPPVSPAPHVDSVWLPGPGPGPVPALAPARRPRLPLVGRRTEVAALMAAWRAARQAPHLALVLGDPGIGKTRLAQELLLRAEHQGVATAAARCYAAAGELAYAPVAAWLRSDAHWPALFTLDDLWLTEVARLIPEILVERPALPPPGPLGESWQRQRLFEALRRALTAPARPLLLLVDDIQWCDHESQEWLHHLMRSQPPTPLLVMATLRTEDAVNRPALAAFLDEMRRSGQLTDVEVGALSASDTLALGEKMLDRVPAAAAAARLVAESEGSPLFVVQLVRAGYVERWEREEQASSDGGTGTEAPRPQSLPPTLMSAIAARLAQLSAPTRELAGVVATIGREFTFELLAQVSSLAEDALLRSVEELLQRRIVREDAGGDYDFAHDKIREVAYNELSATRRRVLHRRIARALEVLNADALAPVSGQIAAHYLKGGEPAQAIPYLERAGDHARLLYANAEAESYYRELVALLERAGRDADAARVHEHLAPVLSLAARFDDALEELESAVALYQRAGDADGVGMATARIGLTHSVRGSPEVGIERVRSLMESASMDAYSPHCKAALFAALAQLYSVSGRYQELLDGAEQAVMWARAAGDTLRLIHAGRLYSLALIMLSRPTEALAALEEVIPLAEAHDDQSNLCFALSNACIAHMVLGHVESSRDYAERAVAGVQRLGSPVTSAFMLCNRADLAILLGQWDAAQRDYERAMQVLAPVAMSWASAYPLLGLGRLALMRGQPEQAERYLLACIETAQASSNLYPLRIAMLTLAEGELLRGDPEAARLRIAPLVEEASGAGVESGEVLAMLALAEIELGHEDVAAELVDRSLAAGAAAENALVQLTALHAKIRLAARRRRWEEAFAAAEEALTRTRALSAPYDEAIMLYECGLLHAATGEPDLARECLNASLAILSRLGERLYAEHVERALHTLD